MADSAIPESELDTEAKKTYRRRVFSWALYDVADHGFITTTATAFFPTYFVTIAAPLFIAAGQVYDNASEATKAVARDSASNTYALILSLSLLAAAILAPLIGTYADITGQRKRLLVVITVIGAVFASMLFTLVTGTWWLGLLMFAIAQIALNTALGLNSSLLQHITRPDDMNRVSSLGYAMGYVGGGILLAVNTALFLFAGKLGLDGATAVRIAFVIVGIWWMIFTIPLALNVPEAPATPLVDGKGKPFQDSVTRLRNTLRDIQRYRELFKMLIAFWLYSEGIGAIITLAAAYGTSLGLSSATVISVLLMTQFVAFPYALLYGRIPDKSSQWRSAYVSMLIWTAITLPLLGLFANLNAHIGTDGTILSELSLPTAFALIAADQVFGALFSIFVGRRLFEGFANRLTTKGATILGLVIYMIIPVWGVFLHSQAEFFMVGWLVGTVQGGTQALSRSIYASMTPSAKSGEFFGLYGLFEKFSALIGPLLYAGVGLLTHDPRASILSIAIFFIVGIYALWRVDERKGAEIAAAEDATIKTAQAAD